MAIALDVVAQLEDVIGGLALTDEDVYLRIDAIRALASSSSQRAREVVRDALLDSHPLVQQAAEAALSERTLSDTVRMPPQAARETQPMELPPAPAVAPESPTEAVV